MSSLMTVGGSCLTCGGVVRTIVVPEGTDGFEGWIRDGSQSPAPEAQDTGSRVVRIIMKRAEVLTYQNLYMSDVSKPSRETGQLSAVEARHSLCRAHVSAPAAALGSPPMLAA
jgi:hypothetical protein